MRVKLWILAWVVILWAATVRQAAAEEIPFVGAFKGQAISAAPTDDPDVLLVTTVGKGRATALGKFTMVSPHYSNLATLGAVGTQTFTTANGDTLTANIKGQFHVLKNGNLAGSLSCTITGGTGRFAGARGRYILDILFDPVTLTDQSAIAGAIVLPNED